MKQFFYNFIFKIFIIFGIITLLTSYQNCGMNAGKYSFGNFKTLQSVMPEIIGCDNTLFLEFVRPNGYYDFLNTKCSTCHSGAIHEAPSFANKDLKMAFDVFKLKEIESNHIISQRAISQHQPGITGTMNSSTIESLNDSFKNPITQYLECMGIDQNIQSKSVKTEELFLDFISDSAVASTDSKNPTKTFNLNSQLEFTIEISRAKNATYAVIKNPKFKLININANEDNVAYQVSNMSIFINGVKSNQMTLYSILNGNICSNTNPTPLLNDKNAEIYVADKYLDTDKISFQFEAVQRVDKNSILCSPDSSGVIAGPTIPDTIKYTDLMATKDLDVFKQKCNSCHNSSSGRLDLTNYSSAKTNAAKIQTRVDNASMPPGGGLSSYEKSLIGKWISLGAPE